jgi:hypothetical protein
LEKGQIFSLDFLISMAVVMVAIGLVIQAAETGAYNAKEARIQGELGSVAETAADLMVAGNETTCVDARGEHLMNCIDTSADFSGITGFLDAAGYGYSITIQGGPSFSTPASPQGQKDYCEASRMVFINKDFSSAPVELKARVWKA